MPKKTLSQKDRALAIQALQGIRRQSDLLLLAFCYHKLKKHVAQRQQGTHLKRCAGLLKHHAIKKTVTCHFIRWLSATQRHTSIVSGMRDPKKIVVLPRAQDFVELGVRYLGRWRLWVRHLRQRKQRNVMLLQNCTNKCLLHKIYLQWRSIQFRREKQRIEAHVRDIENKKSENSASIEELKKQLQKQENTIKNLTRDAEKLQEKNNAQQQKLKNMNKTVEAAISMLDSKGGKVMVTRALRVAEEMAQQGDDVPHRLLIACADAGNALEMLRKTLPKDGALLDGKEAIANAVCQQVKALNTAATEKEQKANTLRAAMLEALKELEKTGNPPSVREDSLREERKQSLNVKRVAEEMAQQGDDVPHRLLIACADVGNALEMLRKTLPKDGALLDGKEAIANAVCQQVRALNTAATEKEQKANTLRAAMLEALKELEKTGNPPSVRGESPREERKQSLNVKRVAEEMAQQGDDVPHRLLIACADAGNALEMLRKTLPKDGALLDGKEAIANAVCQQVRALNTAATEKEQKANTLRAAMLEALKELEKTGNPPSVRGESPREERKQSLNVKRVAEEMAQQGDDVPHRLLIACADAGNALEMLSKTLPKDGALLDGKEAIANAVCQQVRALNTAATEKEQKANTLRAAMLEALKELEKTGNPPSVREDSLREERKQSLNVKRVAEEMAQQGDDVPHRLLIACADAGNALEMLSKTLPKDGALLDGKEAIANAVCQQVRALNTAATEKEQKANTLRAAMLEALKELEKTGNPPSVREDSLREERKQSLNVKRVAEEMAQQGDDVPHRLLIACADAGNALEMLRKTLPKDGALLDGKEAIANAVCQQVKALNTAATEKEQKANTLRAAMLEALKELEKTGNPPSVRGESPREERKQSLNVKRVAEEMAQQGDDVPHRLLIACADAGNALEMLSKTLPKDGALLDGKEAIANAVCQQIDEMNDAVVRLREETIYNRNLALVLLFALKCGASKIIAVARHASPSSASSSERTADDRFSAFLPWCSCSDFTDLENLLHGKNGMEMVRIHLEEKRRLVTDGPSTANVLESFQCALVEIQETLAKCEDLFVEQEDVARQEEEKRKLLVEAAKDAVSALKGWTGENDMSVWQDEDDEVHLVMDVRRESEAASNTLAHLRNLLSGDIMGVSWSQDTLNSSTHSENPFFLQMPVIETHEDLVNAVTKLHSQLKEAGEAYNDMYLELRRLFPESSPSHLGNTRRSSVSATPAEELQQHPVKKKVDLVVSAVNRYIKSRGQEVKELRGVMRRGIEALGGSSDDPDTDDDMDADRSIARSAAVGEKLTLLCRDTGEAIEDARTALGIPKDGKLKLSDVIPSLKDKVNTLEAVTKESAALINEVKGALAYTPCELSSSRLRVLRPKRKPMSVTLDKSVMERMEAVKLSHTQISPKILDQSPLKPADFLRQVRRETQEKAAEMLELRDACSSIISLLDGSYRAGGEPPQYGQALLPLLMTQTQDLKRALHVVDSVLSFSGMRGNGSVGNYLTVLASQLASLRVGNESLRDGINQRMKQTTHLIGDFTNEVNALKQVNKDLTTQVKSLREKLQVQNQVRQHRAERMVEILRLKTIKDVLCKSFIMWLADVVSMRSTQVHGTTEERKRLSIEIVQKQHQQNQLAKLLAITLHALPGGMPRNSNVLDTEHTLMQRAMEGSEGTALEVFVQKGLDGAKEWMRSLSSLFSGVASLRCDIFAFQRLIAEGWSRHIEEACSQILAEASNKLKLIDKKEEMELNFLRNRVLDQESIAYAHEELTNEVSDLKERLELAQDCIEAQDEKIIKLQRANRDLQLNGVLSWDENAEHGPIANDASNAIFNRVSVESSMIKQAKGLALEAINAVVGRDLAACIGEVAELTLEMYRRTIAALEEIANTKSGALCSLPVVAESRLQELRGLYTVRNDIVARLPELFRAPYIE